MNEKIKLTIFSQHFWPENFRINDLALQLKKLDVEVNVFTGKPNYPSGKIKKKFKSLIPIYGNYRGINVLRFPIIARSKATFWKLIFNYISYIFSVTFFSFFFKKNFGNIFFIYATSPIFQAIPAIVIGKIFKIPTVLWVQDLWPYVLKDTKTIENNFIILIIKYFVNKIYDFSDLILCQSEAFYDDLKKKTDTKIKIFHNPSNYQFNFTKRNNNKKYYDIYYTGNLGLGQDFNSILKIFNNQKILENNIRLKIFGSGKNFDDLKKKIKSNNYKNISINKSVNPEKLKIILESADCFFLKLNNGIGLSKTIPAKFQTYLSFGKPIISVNKGIVSKFVNKYKIGLDCKSEKSSDLINVLLRAKNLSNNQLLVISQNCKNLFFEKFEINNSCIKLKKYLKDLK